MATVCAQKWWEGSSKGFEQSIVCTLLATLHILGAEKNSWQPCFSFSPVLRPYLFHYSFILPLKSFFHLFPSLKVYHHHHYHKIELARYSMTRSFHLSLSSIAIGSSSSLHPEGLFNGIFINLIIFYCIPWGFLSYWACTGFISCFLGFSPGNQNLPKPCCCSLLFLSAFGSNTTPHWRYIN